jgi:N-carbamoylputrescine amidase
MLLNVTVCEMRDSAQEFESDWQALSAHVKQRGSDLVLLPELPFAPWFGSERQFDARVWQTAVARHEAWLTRLGELGRAWVVSSRPLSQGEQRFNEGFAWQVEQGYQAVHRKYYLPDEEGTWEASWYQRGSGDFTPVACGQAQVGMLICTELWAMDQAQAYGKAGVQLLATPRLTQGFSVEKWLAAGRTAAVLAGAFSLSSNRVSGDGEGAHYGGRGWIISPNGEILGLTSRIQPFVTVAIDLEETVVARQTYPRYIF